MCPWLWRDVLTGSPTPDVCHSFCTTRSVAPASYRGFQSQARAAASAINQKAHNTVISVSWRNNYKCLLCTLCFLKAASLVETGMGKQVYSGSPILYGIRGPHENTFFFPPPLVTQRWQTFPEQTLSRWIFRTHTLNLTSQEVPGLVERLFPTDVSATQGISLVPGGLVGDYWKLCCSPRLFLVAFLRFRWSSWDSFCYSESKHQASSPESQAKWA